jgi:cytochrome c5
MKAATILSNRNALKLTVVFAGCLTLAGFALSERLGQTDRVVTSVVTEAAIPLADDPVKARAAFNEAIKVFFSARCANCHPAGDTPTQGDEMTPHTMAVTRGTDGHGVYGQKCSTCHQSENLAGEHMPPGTSKEWHMPPANQPMVFQGLTPGQLCRNFKDPKLNGGHQTLREAMDHVQKRDPLVMWGWNPGNGRTLPPMSFEDFSAKVEEWVSNGGACPD